MPARSNQEKKMAQQASSKQTLIIGILSGVLVVSLGITSFLYYQNKSHHQATRPTPPQKVQSTLVQTSPPKLQ